MSAPVLNGPFVLPMFRSFVPRKMHGQVAGTAVQLTQIGRAHV